MGGATRDVIKGYINLSKELPTRASIDEHHFLQLTLVTRKDRRVKNEKLLAKLLNEHMTFTWPELVTLLRRLGYTQIEGAGSRVKFDIGDPSAMITLHKPHPGNELKHYIRRQIIEQLKSGELIQ